MKRFFNVAGPCQPELHYMIPALRRLPELRRVIDQRGYFLLHAPRQVGKTTALIALARELTAEGRYAALLVSMQPGSAFPDQLEMAEAAILEEWRLAAEWALPLELQPPAWPSAVPGARIGAGLAAWARACPRPLVIFLDEIDALEGDVLRSILTQIRAGHARRPSAFPWSLALVGLRNLQDYKIAAGSIQPRPRHAPSPFNILVESYTLRVFTRQEVAELYQQHTTDTGQLFPPEVIERVFALTGGQPWLVNALAREMVEHLEPDRTRPLTLEHVEAAKQLLIERRDAHLGMIADRLRDERILSILEPLLSGRPVGHVDREDLQFALDLGLISPTPEGGIDVANPIYREVLLEELLRSPRAALPRTRATWLTADGRLDPRALRDAFLEFWRQHAEAMFGTVDIPELAPHLVMLAFLSRVVNGGGSVRREEAVERGRMDLLIEHRDLRLPIELKVWHPGRPDPLREGLEQLERYLRGLSLEEGWLVIFDRREHLPPLSARTSWKMHVTPGGLQVTVIRA